MVSIFQISQKTEQRRRQDQISGLWSARVRKDLTKKTGSAEELTFPFGFF
jgi:hypothetical protein